MDSIIVTTPVWLSVIESLKNLQPGGRLVINSISKEEADKESLQGLAYPVHLWLEKGIKSFANICQKDVCEFLALAAQMRIKPEI